MSELRKDPIVDRWVIIAGERSHRPADFQTLDETAIHNAFCPFCPGHENRTPPEIVAYGRSEDAAPNSGDWQVRVVPNKFPVLTIDGQTDPRGQGMYDMMRGVGAHEIIIENPQHSWDMAEATPQELSLVLQAFVNRIADLGKDRRFRCIVVFRNAGSPAGATLEHPHSQVLALPITPRHIKEQLEGARLHFDRKQRCAYCDILHQEESRSERIVEANEHFVVLCPFASRFPFETQILPRHHLHDFTQISQQQTMALAETLARHLRRINQVLSHPAYNLILHTAPPLHPRPGRPHYWGTIEQDYHWHIDILPRLSRTVGFEWANSMYVNSMPPENAAQFLKNENDT